MSDRLDRVLEAVDGGLQRSTEEAMPLPADGKCWRCAVFDAAESSDLCAACRAFLLEDSDVDPNAPDGLKAFVQHELLEALVDRYVNGDGTGEPMGITPEEAEAVIELGRALVAAVRPVLEAFVDVLASLGQALAPVLDRLPPPAARAEPPRRTLPEGRRRGAMPIGSRPPRDLRATEAPRSAPTPRRFHR